MKYKMLILDIDDTLVPRGGGISQKNAVAIQKAREAGVYVTLATGSLTYPRQQGRQATYMVMKLEKGKQPEVELKTV